MKITVVSSAAIALSLLAAPAAQATVIAGLGNNGSSFVTIDSLGTRSGGTIYTADQPFADIPKGGVFNNQFLAVGKTAGTPSTITFANALNYLSFLWGSPDTYNLLTLTTNLGNTFAYTPQSLNFAVTDGNQAFSQYVQFQASGGEFITSAKFDVTPANDAFEVANFSTGLPEPATWTLMIMGIGFAGAAMRLRQTVSLKYAGSTRSKTRQ
ncbi:PEPxxWA-CTERM sorting domain-containing protein [Novosphingobium sp. G106]|uniref:Npun_F0296 family exosortase-dependent surface protein n=1 Tax=Novosphingobium sp. G106 TaxID=2849500 RepID=UPI001C2D4A08|nr:PEPxxWA-CTERM sorting domain-containing protein [Novosphingobium sp. G106]MBV1687282.1 PEPxxWA-CTERM sorting domain-containing protein [Novosphingobium sp. G106]